MPKRLWLHILLFLLTLVTTTLAGVDHIQADYDFEGLKKGLHYSIPFLLFLTAHEFGHYFMAKYHKVKTSLPFYIPLWIPMMSFIGTMGALIQLKSPTRSTKEVFDIGVAGPLAGFVVALGILFYGFRTLPEKEYILQVDPAYQEVYDKYGADDFLEHLNEPLIDSAKANDWNGVGVFKFGSSLLFDFFKEYVAKDPDRVPDEFNVIHYPYLFAGFFALFFTALNLLPIGQLDGGHVIFGLFGLKKQRVISFVFFTVLVLYAGMGLEYISFQYVSKSEVGLNLLLYSGFLYFLYEKLIEDKMNRFIMVLSIVAIHFGSTFIDGLGGYTSWLLYALLLSRVLGVYHPPVYVEHKLDTKRKIIGWVCLVIFVLSITPNPIDIVELL